MLYNLFLADENLFPRDCAVSPAHTKHLYTICTMLSPRCTNVIQMICVSGSKQLFFLSVVGITQTPTEGSAKLFNLNFHLLEVVC